MKKETVKKFFEFLEKRERRREPFAMRIMRRVQKDLDTGKYDNRRKLKGDLTYGEKEEREGYLQEGDVIIGNLLPWGDVTLPRNLTILGNLGARESKLRILPDGLIVRGILDISETYIKHVGRGMIIEILIAGATRFEELEGRDLTEKTLRELFKQKNSKIIEGIDLWEED